MKRKLISQGGENKKEIVRIYKYCICIYYNHVYEKHISYIYIKYGRAEGSEKYMQYEKHRGNISAQVRLLSNEEKDNETW